MENNIMIKASGVSKEYRLGAIGGTTLREDLQRLGAKIRKKEDPTLRIGQKPVANAGEKFLALNDVSFEIKKGEAVGIIGHNGAGKSTLLKLITRVTAPSSGFIGLNGRVASMLEVGTGFHPELTGRENIYMNGAILGMSRKEIDGKIEKIIDFSEVRQFIDTPVKRYSSGMYVKLAFSVAAHLDSEIVIMDEVLAVGDMAFQKKCITKMREAAETEGRTVLYVSHNMNTIRQLCDRVIVLEKGRIVFQGDVEQGIDRYLGTADSFQSITDCSKIAREHIGDRKINIQTIEMLNSNNGIIYDNQPLKLKVSYHSDSDFQKLAFRTIIFNSHRIPIGMCASHPIISAQIGDNSFECSISLPTISEERYYARAVLYEVNNFGNEQIHDVVEPAFSFQKAIRNSMNDTAKRWNQQVWGNIVMQTIQIDRNK